MSIDIVSVTVQTPRPLVGAAVEQPKPADVAAGWTLELTGWVAAGGAPVEKVEILHGNLLVRSTPVDVQRRDVDRALNRADGPPVAFRTLVGLLGLPYRPILSVCARVGGERVPFAEIQLRRSRVRSGYTPSIHPMIVTTMGRTGSVWLAQLVSQHPEILAYRPFETEPRVASYWMHALRALADPASYLQGIAPRSMVGEWWVGAPHAAALPRVPDAPLAEWLAGERAERIASFCQESVDAFYRNVAELERKPGARFFSEKYLPSFVVSLLLELDADAREVFLVRDPRDQLASVIAWHSVPGRSNFGDPARQPDDWVKWLAPRTKRLLAHWQARRDDALLVRYEDLALDTEETLTSIFDFLGVDSRARTVDAVVEAARRRVPDLQERHRTTESPRTSVGRWRTDIDETIRERLADEFSEELEAWYADARGGAHADAR